MKLLLAVAGLALLGIAGGIVYVVAPGSEEEVVEGVQTATPCASATLEPSPSTTPTATPPASSPSPTAEPSPEAIPAEWKTYVDPVLGFSLRYPPDLVLKDLTPSPGTGGLYERVLDFRSATDASRAVSIEVSSNGPKLTAQNWALTHTACLADTIEQRTLAGEPAVSCTEQATEIPNALVVLEHMGKMYEIGSLLTSGEFHSLLTSLRLSASPASPTAEPSPKAIPPDWKSYVDPVLGFSLRYPPDLTVTDTGPAPSGGLRERDLDFRAPEDPSRAFVIAMVENTGGRSLEQWVAEFAACLPDTIKQGTVSGTPAIFCTSDAGEGPSGAAAFEHMGTMFLIRSTTPASEFESVLASLRLSPEVIPADWKTYVDPVLGFSLRYPSHLVLTDLTGPTPAGGLQERVLLARAAQDQGRVLSISIIESNPKGLAIDQWAVEYAACNPKSIQPGALGGTPAILCTREAFEERAEPAVLAEVGGRIFLITNGSGLTSDEFSAVARSFQP